MESHPQLETLFVAQGYTDFKWITPEDIVVAHWERMKCMYGCKSYGKNASCPPSAPSVAECQRFFAEYRRAALFHFEKTVDKPADRHAWSREVNYGLVKLERAVFLARYQKAFLLAMDSCGLCTPCPGVRDACKYPHAARPSPEVMAVDVFATVRRAGYPIEVLSAYSQAINRYAMLLID